jgi:hypothetical protein
VRRTGSPARLVATGTVALAVGLYAERAYARTGAGPAALVRDLMVGWTFVAAGLVARWRRPGSRTGSLLVVEGLTWFIGNLQGSGLPLLIAAGAWLEALNDVVLAHLALSFPVGRLDTRSARALVGAGYGLVLGLGLLRALSFDPSADPWATYLSCPRCGPNALLVDPDPARFAAIDLLYRCLLGAFALACAAVLARRWLVSSEAARRMLLPTWMAALVAVAIVGWGVLGGLVARRLASPTEPVLWAADLGQLAVAVALLWGLLRTRPRAAGAGGDAHRADAQTGRCRPGVRPPESGLPEERSVLDAVNAAMSTLSALRRLDIGEAAPDPAVRALVAEASEELEQALDELEAVRRRRTRHGP